MAVTTAILGASGYSGQETLDRVLAHPELELVALGSDSLAGSPASVARPAAERLAARVRHERRGARGRRRRSSSAASSTSGRPRSSRPPTPSSSTSRARTGSPTPSLYPAWYGFEHPRPGALGDWSYAIPELFPPERAADREPRLLRDRRPARAGAARRRDRAGRRRRRREVGRLRRGADAEGVVARGLGARERLAVQGRLAPARARDRAGARLPRLLRPAPAAGEARAARDLLRHARPPTCATRSRRRTPRRRPSRCCRRGSRPSSRASRAPTAPRSASSPTARPGRAIVVCALDNLGKGAAGQAVQNANLALGLPETAGLRLSGVLGVSVTAAKGFAAVGRPRGHPAQGARPRRRPLDRPRGRRGDVHASTRCSLRRSSSRSSTSRWPSRRRS